MLTGHCLLCLLSLLLLASYFFLCVIWFLVLFVSVVFKVQHLRISIQIVWGG